MKKFHFPKMDRNSLLFLSAILLLSIALLPAAAQAAPAAAPPVPKQPSGKTTDTTPTFVWTGVAGATAYQLQVMQVYTIGVATSACGASTCSKAPGTVLVPGPYSWRVRAKVGGVWQAWSALKSFLVAAGFSEGFNGGSTGWAQFHGTWIYDAMTVYSEGTAGDYDSFYYSYLKYSTFTYEVKLKRSSGGSTNGLYFRGLRNDFNPTTFVWSNTFLFLYTNNGDFFIGWLEDGNVKSPTGYVASSAIVPNGWNRLKVTANGNYMRFYINNTLVADGYFAVFNNGFVGVFMFTDTGRLDIDWATLSTSAPAAPDAAADAAGVLHLDESMAVPFELPQGP